MSVTLAPGMATEQKLHIAYDDAGSGDLAVVLVHGMFGNRTYYVAQVEHLAKRARVLSIDLRGHGESDVAEDGYTMNALADDVARVCDEAGVTRAVFCGHSFGIVRKLAVRRPDLVAGLVFLDGSMLFPPPVTQGQKHLIQVLETDAWRDALIGFFTSIAGPAAERVRADISRVPRCYAAPLLRDLVDDSTSGRDAAELSSLQCPLMFVHSMSPADLARLRKLQPDAIVEEIPDAGHWSMLTVPDRVNTLLDRFLEVIA